MHHQGFERLIRTMDEVADQVDEPVVMQIGASTYEPLHAEWFRFADQERAEELFASASVIVAHAGAGTIISAFRFQRPLVVVPRRQSHREHMDDHQFELAQALSEQGKVVLVENPTAEAVVEGIAQAAGIPPPPRDGARLAEAVAKILVAKGPSRPRESRCRQQES